MRNVYVICFIALMLSASLSLEAQHDTTSTQEITYAPTQSAGGFKLKPRLGLGVGSLVFYGDIGRDNKGYHAGSADMAYMLSLTNDITSFLDLSVYTLFGTININEHTTSRALNMQSQIRSSGVMFTYNFDHFLPATRSADPFIGVGFESFEFLSKTDLYDANGNRYHYWDDGRIMDRPQNSENASNAQELVRDYVYETDLRELNLDGNGAYPERSFAIPITAGVQFRVTDRFRARLGTRYMFTFTDLVDNITSESTGARKGDRKNDRFLYTHVTVNYDLNPLKMKGKRNDDPYFDMDDKELMASLEDSDGDGVADIFDKCAGTPPGVEVDKNGCPIDSDGDGIPDYRDEEPFSPHTYVDPSGVAMDDDEIYRRYLMWHDSIPWTGGPILNEDHARVNSDFSRAPKDVYRVRITRDTEGLSQEHINKLLAQNDVENGIEDGEEYFLVGNYDEAPDAIRRKIELTKSGIPGAVVTGNKSDGAYSNYDVDPELEASIEAEMQLHEDDDQSVHYRIQVGAFRGLVSTEIFNRAGEVLAVKGDDGLTRFITRSYDNLDDALDRKTGLLKNGFTGAFIAAYRGGVRITLAEAGMNVKIKEKDKLVDVEVNPVNQSLVKFRVIYGEFEGDIPTDQLDIMLELGNIRPQRQPDGKTIFMSDAFDSIEDANDLRDKAQELGINTPSILGEFNLNLIPLDDALKLKKVGPQQVDLRR